MATTPVPNLQRIQATVARYNTVTAQLEQMRTVQTAADAPGARCFVTVDGAGMPVQIDAADAGRAIFGAMGPLLFEQDKLAKALDQASKGLPNT